jgi:hypothetical protein
MRRRRLNVCLAAAALVLLAPGAGQAAAPQEERTERTAGQAAQAAPNPADGGGLPFSGLDVALLMAGGGPLLLIGVTLKRRQPKPQVQRSEETLTLA